MGRVDSEIDKGKFSSKECYSLFFSFGNILSGRVDFCLRLLMQVSIRDTYF